MKKFSSQKVTQKELTSIKRAALPLFKEASFGSVLANFEFAFSTASKEVLGGHSFSCLSDSEYRRIETATKSHVLKGD